MAKREVISSRVYGGVFSALRLWGSVLSWGEESPLKVALTDGESPQAR